MTVYLTKSMLAKMNRLRYPATSPYEDETSSNSNEHWQKLMLDNKISERLAKDMLCRVCAKNGCTPINDKINGCTIMSAISSITNINISPEDSLPKFICTDCLEALKVALSFKKNCEASDRKFKKIINPGGDPLFHSYPYSKHDFQLILHQMKLNRMKYEEIKEKERQEKIRLMNKKLKVLKISKGPRMKLFKCSPCDVTFPTKEKLVAHRRERQCTRRACDVCGQLVLNITQHMRHIHKETVPHKCPTCGKEFPIIARLKNHMLVHTDTFSFFCDLCPYKSKHKYYLVMHMRTHTGEKPYKCAHCPATFVNPSNLNKHKLTHQEKRFKCMLCEKAFRTSTALREHHEAAHMNIKHTCNYCGRDFCYKSDLRKHEIRNHNRLKRDYVGGEPTYKQVERLKMQQSNEADKWQETPQVSIAAPLTSHVTSYATHVTPHVTHATHVPSHVTHAAPLVQTTYLDQNKEFIQTTTHEVYLSDVIGLLQQRQPQMVQPQAVQIPMSDVPCAGSNCIFLE